MGSLVSTEMRRAVGTELGRRISHPVSDADIRRWVLATYWPHDAPARFLGAGPLVAPEEFNAFAWAVAGRSGVEDHEGHPDQIELMLGIAGPGLSLMLNGGMEVEYGVPMVAGDQITSVEVLAGYTEKVGRAGPLLFTTTVDTWTNQRDEMVKRSEQILVRY